MNDLNPKAQSDLQPPSPFIPLDENKIRSHLKNQHFIKPLDFHLFADIDSTNLYLKTAPASPSLSICCAEKQTEGRGRFGRPWRSPFGENIYFSGRWKWPYGLSALSGLGLVVSLAVRASLNNRIDCEDIVIKWPNDLLWKKKKLAGILIEINAESQDVAQLIIGIGLNTNTATQYHPLSDKPSCSLYEITGRHHDRNLLISDLIFFLDNYMDRFIDQGFRGFHDEWQQVDCLLNQWISVSQQTGLIYGQALGVNDYGQLRLLDEEGTLHDLSSGDTTLSHNR